MSYSLTRRINSAAMTRWMTSFARSSRTLATVKILPHRQLLTPMLPTQNNRFMSSLSSFAEPDPTLFAKNISVDDPEAPLRSDIRAMGSLLGRIIQEHEGPDTFDKVEKMRAMAKTWRDQGKKEDELQDLAGFAAKLSDKELFTISRAFTHFLAIANAAERHHRVRRLRTSEPSGGLHNKADSCGGAIPQLLKEFLTREDIFEALSTQTVELVLTAHPTEVNRRTILNKKRQLEEIMTRADELRLTGATSFDVLQLDDAMYREISSIWQSDEISRKKPTPEIEAEKNTLVLETVLWEAVPKFLRKLDATCAEFLHKKLPLDSAPIRFASWMGGDRDGNPNVKADTTRLVCLRNRGKAASLFGKDLATLEGDLSLTTCSDELRDIVGDAREPYRSFLKPIMNKMKNTELWAEQQITNLKHEKHAIGTVSVDIEDIYVSKDELLGELMLIHRSLTATGNAVAADGLLTDIIRNVSAFGLTLIPLDVRQESDRHEEAIDCITRYLGLGSFSQWDEETRVSWLTTQIANKRPLLRDGAWHEHPDIFPETAVETFETFKMIAEQSEGSLGAYVISQATSASDVLSVLLLQLDAGVKKPIRVAPLFETLEDLNGAVKTMRTLFSNSTYMGLINGKQEVMIGYSDSAKDAGRLAASWAQFETQEKLAALAKEKGVDMTFFHGKGGTVGRGGNPQTFAAIMSHAPGTINGKFRVTEQGEMINQNFGFAAIAERTLDIYTAAVLSEKLTKRPTPSAEWRSIMKSVSEVSCEAYRKIVRGDERFVPYFRSATPELELSNLNIGSRPAKRKATGGVESLRAIPWNFSWTQTRFNLPTWLGVGDAIRSFLQGEKSAQFQAMYNEWGSFRTTIDLVEMVLAKSEPAIAAHYDKTLVKDPQAKELGEDVRKLHLETEQAIRDLTGHATLGENNPLLQRALAVRNPYVDCLNILQAETLSRIRENEDDPVLTDALLTTITGVANGMGNTG